MAILAALGTGAVSAADRPPTMHTADEQAGRAEELMDKLVGHWVLTGVIAGRETVHDVEAAWVLQRKYVRVTETSRERRGDGRPMYEATIYVGWLEAAHHYVCVWLDNTEVASGDVTCQAAETPNAMPFEFRDAHGAITFTNSFVYERANDTWEWRMANIHDGASDPFGHVTLRRR